MILNIHESGKFCTKKRNNPEDVGKINYLMLMKREILVEVWLKSADGDHKEVKNQKWVFEWYPNGRTHGCTGIARPPRLTVD